MKKILIVMGTTFLIIIIILAIILLNLKNVNQGLRKENSEYEYYTNGEIFGTDITTLINKAMNNNIKHEIPRDENENFVQDEKYCIKIYVEMLGTGETYEMEKIAELGTNQFVELFGTSTFKAKEVKYHKNTGRIAKIIFTQTVE